MTRAYLSRIYEWWLSVGEAIHYLVRNASSCLLVHRKQPQSFRRFTAHVFFLFFLLLKPGDYDADSSVIVVAWKKQDFLKATYILSRLGFLCCLRKAFSVSVALIPFIEQHLPRLPVSIPVMLSLSSANRWWGEPSVSTNLTLRCQNENCSDTIKLSLKQMPSSWLV